MLKRLGQGEFQASLSYGMRLSQRTKKILKEWRGKRFFRLVSRLQWGVLGVIDVGDHSEREHPGSRGV